MNGFLRTGVLLAGGVVGVLAGRAMGWAGPALECATDVRCRTLQSFFSGRGSPLENVAAVFIATADQHQLDWRLLPAIAMVESGGGRYGRRNNVFGWNSGRTRFETVAAGIEFVASRLAHSPIYRGRTSRGILAAYNPSRQKYPPRVIRFMEMLDGSPVE
jgi:hypothetical protein